jgi:HK97 gp10 family phage protein
MLTIKVTGIGKVKSDVSSSYKQLITALATDLTRELQQNTPVRSGRAQAGWNKQVGNKDFVIENKVPYSGYLESGTNKMRPANNGRGIIGPALNSIKGKYK